MAPENVQHKATGFTNLIASILLLALAVACGSSGEGRGGPEDSRKAADAATDRTEPADTVEDTRANDLLSWTDLVQPDTSVDQELSPDGVDLAQEVSAEPPRTALLLDFEMRHPTR